MKKYLNFLTVITTLGLILLPTLVCASDQPIYLQEAWRHFSFHPDKSDASVGFLLKLFGYVPGVPELVGGSPTLISLIFGILNAAVLTISGVFLIYSVGRYITETTMDGQPMARSGTMWTAFRAATSVGLLVPQVSGYSIINGIVMWVVVQGVGLANITWSATIDFLQKSGPSFAPTNQVVDYSLVAPSGEASFKISVWEPPPKVAADVAAKIDRSAEETSPVYYVSAADVLRSLTCAYAIEDALKQNQSKFRSDLSKIVARNTAEEASYVNSAKAISGNLILPYKFVDSSVGKYVQFPYIANDLAKYGLKPGSYPSADVLNGICGKYTWVTATSNGAATDQSSTDSDKSIAATATSDDSYSAAKKEGLSQMITVLTPTAQQIILEATTQNDKTISKRRLDPDSFIVGKDKNGKELKFFDPTISRKTPHCTNPAAKECNITAYLKVPDTKRHDNKKSLIASNFNIPLGAADILHAAVNYQMAVYNAQTQSLADLKKDLQANAQTAKDQGWINAGAYYQWIGQDYNTVEMERDRYRSTLLVTSSEQSIKRDSGVFPYEALFNFDGNGPGGETTVVKEALEQIYPESSKALELGLKQIFFAASYAPFIGEKYGAIPAQQGAGNSISGPLAEWSYSGEINGARVLVALSGVSVASVAAAPAAVPAIVSSYWLFLKASLMKVQQVTEEQFADRSKNPIAKEMAIGNEMMTQGVIFWTNMIETSSTMSVASMIANAMLTGMSWGFAGCSMFGTCTGSSQAIGQMGLYANTNSKIISDFMYLFVPIGLAVTGPMFVSGMILAIYVPLIPFIIFLFGAIGWLASVLTLMIAAPIVCFFMLWGSTSGDNHLLVREAEQLLLQLIGIFFRPMLMIFGLCASMLFSYIALDVFNLGFARIAGFIQSVNSASSAGDILSIAPLVKSGIIFASRTFIVFAIIQACAKLITELPDSVLKAARIEMVSPEMGREALDTVKGNITNVGAEKGLEGTAQKGTSSPGLAQQNTGGYNKKSSEDGFSIGRS